VGKEGLVVTVEARAGVRAAHAAGFGLLGLLAFVWAGLAQESTPHPALKPAAGQVGVDFRACVECHADKSAGAVVHPALEMGCDGCHQVRQEEDETEILLTADGNQLCYTCHDDKRPAASQLSLHSPVRTGKCTACHEPHSSQLTHLLRRGTEGREPAENLCLGCHAGIQAQIQKPIQHAAVDLGCAACHTTHKSAPEGTPEGVFHLTKPQPELCLDCHDAGDATVQAAHLNQPIARARCSECHNPHGSEQAKLLNNFVHSPFGEKQCDTCHETPEEGGSALMEGARRELCLTCHSDMQERLDQAKATHTALSGESGCVACHSPHAATYPHQVRRGPVDLCLGCHTGLAQARTQKAFLHRPAFEQSCLICHQEHTGERPQRLRAEVGALCLECHGSQNAPKFQAGGRVKLFGDTVEAEANAFAGMRILSIQAGATRGHPFPAHPVAGEDPLNCVTCHNPHAANGSPKLLATETATSTELCVKCHK
jgi:predicted CXXCH cytochrome family protein